MDTETMLIKAARGGDSRALAELLRQNYSFLYRYTLKLLLDKSRAEDITQDTMVKAIEKFGSYREEAKFSTWLITIASRLCMDKYKRQKNEQRLISDSLTQRSIQYEASYRMDEWPAALQALSKLEHRLRTVVLLKHYYGYSQEEIGDMLEIPTGTVKSRLHAGIKLLREELTEDEQKRQAEG